MKHICIVGVAILIAACSSHRVRCEGALRPINKPVAATKPTVQGSATAPPVPAAAAPGPAAAAPGPAVAAPGSAAAKPHSLPTEPRP
jgi:hypothetical protein